VADLTWRNVASITWWRGDETGPRRVGRTPAPRRAGRYIGELARRVPATGVETTLVTRRDDTLRWHDWSPSTHIASIVPTPAHSTALRGVGGRSQFDGAIG